MALGLKSQIAEVKRELALRHDVYSRETKPKKISENGLHLEHMAAVLKTLEWLHGQNVPHDLPRPGDLLAAILYVRRLLAVPITAGAAGKRETNQRLEEARSAIDNALQGLPPPDMLSDDELKASIEALEARLAGDLEDEFDPEAYGAASAKLKRMRAARGPA
jgi:hypothetical protein